MLPMMLVEPESDATTYKLIAGWLLLTQAEAKHCGPQCVRKGQVLVPSSQERLSEKKPWNTASHF